jgi:hypothetical protein
VPGVKEGEVTVYYGGYTTSGCLEASTTQTGKFEWYPGVVKAGFKTTIKPLTTATLETISKVKVTCTGESSTGAITGSNLEGVVAIEKITFKEGKEIRHVALDLYPIGRTGAFLEYTCAGSGLTTLDGSLLAPVTAGKMLKTATLKFMATAGKQKPEQLEGGGPEFLTNSLFEEVGLNLASTQTNEEAVEINTMA